MRNPELNNSLIIPIHDEDYEVIQLGELPIYDFTGEYDLDDEKSFNEYVRDIKRICRSSFEYKKMINFLRDFLNLNESSYYKNVSNIDSFNITIQIHHEPFTIEDIIVIVINKRKATNETMLPEQVAKEVMYLHYDLKVGLIPLSKTEHELVHNQYLFIPSDVVLGNYKTFVNLYEPYISEDLLDTLDIILEHTKNYRYDDVNVLNKKYLYVDVGEQYNIPNLGELKLVIENVINNGDDFTPHDNVDNHNKELIIPMIIN